MAIKKDYSTKIPEVGEKVTTIQYPDSNANNLWFEIQQEIQSFSRRIGTIEANINEVITNEKHNLLKITFNFKDMNSKDRFVLLLKKFESEYFSYTFNYVDFENKVCYDELTHPLSNTFLSIAFTKIRKLPKRG